MIGERKRDGAAALGPRARLIVDIGRDVALEVDSTGLAKAAGAVTTQSSASGGYFDDGRRPLRDKKRERVAVDTLQGVHIDGDGVRVVVGSSGVRATRGGDYEE